ncbi:putative response regulatory protein [Clostridium puniceum]|uniref:Stage 0 sporulation protein A homolog n=1 Tax=Clostridium puniceum TaxID=29367 RepID=A0A1S8TWY1_9CLOT|nr:AraC family transcriptional regulator [Clostridium puniceum]OOM82246.1 putative response regulatory protein [Clostridium puniceum]
MYKLLIVDDEPLVQIGVKSMLNWVDYEIEVIGSAANGKQALDVIESNMPDIVITDIKMPIMDGLELTKYCMDNFEKPPIFIILTSYEEFELAKRAIKYNVIDYLIKLELDANLLKESIEKVLIKVKKNYEQKENLQNVPKGDSMAHIFEEKFFVKLLYNLFENEEQINMQLNDLKLDLAGDRFLACFCEISGNNEDTLSNEQILNQYICTLNMVREIAVKYLKCFIISLDYKHFVIICCFEKDQIENINKVVSTSLEKVSLMICKYFNVQIKIGIGNSYDKLKSIDASFEEARHCFNSSDNEERISFYCDLKKTSYVEETFDISFFKEDLVKAFEEYDTEEIYRIFSQIIKVFNEQPTKYLQAIDCACNILYLCLNLLPYGENCISEIFSNEIDGYKSIYAKKNVEQINCWVALLRDKLCEYLEERKKDYKHNIINHVKKYINEHLEDKLSLNEIASLYSISPSYLSALFKKYCDIGFSEYITHMKINKAKELLLKENYKVYEVSDMLGFESAFYFSKVFKKVTGYSPKEYTQKQA